MKTQFKHLKKAVALTQFGAIMFFNVQQAEAQLELSLGAGGGISSLQAETSLSTGNGFGGQVGIGLSYFWSDNWGIGTGAGLSIYKGSISADSAKSYCLDLTDRDGESYDLRTTLYNYKESQTITMLTVPLMLYFRSSSSGGFRMGVGVKLGFPVKAKYKDDAFNLRNIGWYLDYGFEGEAATGPKFEGFGSFDLPETKGSFDLKTSYMASVEIGYEFQILNSLGLYAGVYMDYGLNDLCNYKTAAFVIPNDEDRANFATRPIIASTDENQEVFVSKLSPLSAGIMLKLTLGAKRSGQKKGKSKNTIWHVERNSQI